MNTLLNQETDDALINEKKWQAVVHKDQAADGTFYYSVKTTGVYCRPSCATTRPALRKNVAFHNSPEDAERAGFRACKRCAPKGRRWPRSAPPRWRKPAASSKPPKSRRRSTPWRRRRG